MKLPSILYVWGGYYPWDVRTEKLCGSLGKRGYTVAFTARNRERKIPIEEFPEGTLYRVPHIPWVPDTVEWATSMPSFANPRWLRHLRRTAEATKPDVLIVRELPLCVPV